MQFIAIPNFIIQNHQTKCLPWKSKIITWNQYIQLEKSKLNAMVQSQMCHYIKHGFLYINDHHLERNSFLKLKYSSLNLFKISINLADSLSRDSFWLPKVLSVNMQRFSFSSIIYLNSYKKSHKTSSTIPALNVNKWHAIPISMVFMVTRP